MWAEIAISCRIVCRQPSAMAEGYDVHVIAGDSGLGDVIKREGVTFYPRWLQEDKVPAFSLLLGLIQILMVGVKCRAHFQVVG